jgi:hypothetical protein
MEMHHFFLVVYGATSPSRTGMPNERIVLTAQSDPSRRFCAESCKSKGVQVQSRRSFFEEPE